MEGDVNILELLQGSLDIGIDTVEVVELDPVAGTETQDGEGSEGVDQDEQTHASQTFSEVRAMEFDSPEAVVCFYK
ncbi:hypothetical protein PIB30_050567 [Stylosanthes scabra]|uniref:Uncharacterized protein n=1 Tax=Stylosanthes scabra TaxID=79078 RepID=A0ABU6RHS9_9FABA|nr:hypothetical protein [Stylosanthes scabra]